jgi:hypothetical protein
MAQSQTHTVHHADGTISTWIEREWTAGGQRCTIDRRRPSHTTAKAYVRLTAEGNGWVDLTTTWHREPPYSSYQEFSRCWWYVDSDGGRWTVEYGHDGRRWVLFGPAMAPDGYPLDRTIKGSLIGATEYIARNIARAQDADVAVPPPEELS